MVYKYIIKHKSSETKMPMIVFSCINDYTATTNIDINNYILRINTNHIPKTLFKPFTSETPATIINSSR
jgi:hypothetical protein